MALAVEIGMLLSMTFLERTSMNKPSVFPKSLKLRGPLSKRFDYNFVISVIYVKHLKTNSSLLKDVSRQI